MGEVLHFRSRSAGSSPAPFGAPFDAPPARRPTDPLWREVVGRVLRERRHARAETLAQVAGRAGISVPYLSEIERGRKEASSEVLAAAAGALDLRLVELTAAALAVLTPLDLTSTPPDRHTPPSRPRGPVALAC